MEYCLFFSPIIYYYYTSFIKKDEYLNSLIQNNYNQLTDPFQHCFKVKYYYHIDKLIIAFNLYYRIFYINNYALYYSVGLLYGQKIILSYLFQHRHRINNIIVYNTFFNLHTGLSVLICIYSNNTIIYFIASIYMSIIYLEKQCKLFDIFIGINAGVLSYYIGTALFQYRINGSLIDFCEENFYITNYIPEFLNTASSLMWGWYATCKFYKVAFDEKYHIHKKYMKLLNIFIACASAMLHGSLLRIWQISDEFLIICFLNACQLYMIEKFHYIIFTYTFLYFGYFYFSFNYYISILIGIGLHNIYTFYKKKNYVPKDAFFLSLISIIIWFTDWYICNNFIPLHALWHLCIGKSVDLWIEYL